MVPPNDRSIRNIPVSGRGRKREPAAVEAEDDTVDPIAMREARPMMRRKPRRGRRWFLIAAAVVVVVCAIGGLLLSTLFAGATVTVVPQTQAVTPPPHYHRRAQSVRGPAWLRNPHRQPLRHDIRQCIRHQTGFRQCIRRHYYLQYVGYRKPAAHRQHALCRSRRQNISYP